MYVYDTTSATFELLTNSNDTTIVDRYHAHFFKTNLGELQISQGVGRTDIEESTELNNTFTFNLDTRQWTEVYPNPELPYQRRHGVIFQLQVQDHIYGFLYSGDVNTEDRQACCGCLFATETDTRMMANALEGEGGWVDISRLIGGNPVPVKYPGYAMIGDSLYVFSGQDVDIMTGQVFYDNVRVLRMES